MEKEEIDACINMLVKHKVLCRKKDGVKTTLKFKKLMSKKTLEQLDTKKIINKKTVISSVKEGMVLAITELCQPIERELLLTSAFIVSIMIDPNKVEEVVQLKW